MISSETSTLHVPVPSSLIKHHVQEIALNVEQKQIFMFEQVSCIYNDLILKIGQPKIDDEIFKSGKQGALPSKRLHDHKILYESSWSLNPKKKKIIQNNSILFTHLLMI